MPGLPVPTPTDAAAAAANLYGATLGGGLADIRAHVRPLYHRFFRANDLAGGRLTLTGRTLELSAVRVPVPAVAGRGDGIAPIAACHHVGELLTRAPSVELEIASGGHLGVLTGRAARGTTWLMLDRFLAAQSARAAVRGGAAFVAGSRSLGG